MIEATPPAGMDIHPYLERWHMLEPHRCKHDTGDYWLLAFASASGPSEGWRRYDVISFQGVGAIEDLIAECVGDRPGWTCRVNFDRDAETFTGFVVVSDRLFEGEESLNPGIALLSAYLKALNGK